MSMFQPIDIAAAVPAFPTDFDRRGSLSGEVFPWQEESRAEKFSGRITSAIAGIFLMVLVVLANAAPITALKASMLSKAPAAQPDSPIIVAPQRRPRRSRRIKAPCPRPE